MLSSNIPLAEDLTTVTETAKERRAVLYLSGVKQPAAVAFRKPKEVLNFQLIRPLHFPPSETITRKETSPLRTRSPDSPLRHRASPTQPLRRSLLTAKTANCSPMRPLRYPSPATLERDYPIREQSPLRTSSPLREISAHSVDTIAKMKQYLADNPRRYTYQIAPDRLLVLEEVHT